MQDTKFDSTMTELFVDAIEWLKARRFDERRAENLRVVALELLEEGHDDFVAARDRAMAEGDDWKKAALELELADRASEESFESLSYLAQGEALRLKAAAPADARRFETGYKLAFGDWTPYSFARMDLDRSVDVLARVVAFCEVHFGPNNDHVVAGKEAHEALDLVRRLARQEQSDYATAMTALVAARDGAKKTYAAARDVLSGAFRLIDSDDLTQAMPALYKIYDSSGNSKKVQPDTEQEPAAPSLPTDPVEPSND